MSAKLEKFGKLSFPHYHLVPDELGANLAFRKKLLKMARGNRKMQEQLKQMCAEDLLFYINAFCMTFDPRESDNRVLPFITYKEFQDEAMAQMADAILTGVDCALPKSRCMGASWMGLTVFEWFWHFWHDMSFLLISRNEKYVDENGNPKSLFWKIDFLHQHQPKWLLPPSREFGWKDPSRRLLHLGNTETNSVIDGESTTGDAGRGDRRTAMFIDEHAAFETNDGFRVLRASRDTTKCRIFNSTPQGSANAFYEVVHNTAARIIRMHWTKHPSYNKGLYVSEKGKVKLLDDWRGMAMVRTKHSSEVQYVHYPEDYPIFVSLRLAPHHLPW